MRSLGLATPQASSDSANRGRLSKRGRRLEWSPAVNIYDNCQLIMLTIWERTSFGGIYSWGLLNVSFFRPLMLYCLTSSKVSFVESNWEGQ